MLLDLKRIYQEYFISDILSIFGFFVTLFGFAVTIYKVGRAKNAAQQASEAARQVRDSIVVFNVLADLSAAITIFDEIKRLHRAKSWEITLDRYAHLRRNLISIKHNCPSLSDSHKVAIQSTIVYLADIEAALEKSIEQKREPDNVPRINKILSLKADEVHQLLVDLKLQVEG